MVEASWLEPERIIRGAESVRAAQARGLRVIRSVCSRHPDSRVVISTHGNLLAAVVNALDSGFGHEFWKGLTFPDIYELQMQGAHLQDMRRRWGEPSQTSGRS